MFQRLASEIRRRKVLRVVTVYALTAWVVLQVGVVISEPLNFPQWTMRALIIAAIVGFPITFVLAWVIDIRPEGLIFDLPLLGGAAEREQQKSDLILAALLVGLLGVSAYYLVFMLLEETENLITSEHAENDKVAQKTIAPNSIAVLPFENYSGSMETEYFAAGLAEEIIITLSSLRELKVASRTASFQFRDPTADIASIANDLAVANVLTGSARQADGRVIVASYLTKANSNYINWVKKFERPVDDIFRIQQEIASSIVESLKLVLSTDSEAKLKEQATDSSQAYIQYIEGIGRLRSSRDVDTMIEASKLFQKAIAIDAHFARAYAGICEAFLRIYEKSNNRDDFDEAEKACNKAEQLDATLGADVSLALGKLYLFKGIYDSAEIQLNKALELSTDPADVYIELGDLRNREGRIAEAEQLLLKAIELRPDYWASEEALARFLYQNKRYGEAVTRLERAAELAPNVASVYGGMGLSYSMLGDFDQAIKSYQKSLDIKPTRQAHTNLGLIYYYNKDFDGAIQNQQKALELAPEDHRVRGRLGEAYYFAGQRENAKSSFKPAVKMAESNLKINDQDIKSIRQLAVYYAHLGRTNDARKMSDRAIRLTPEHPESYYVAAQVHVLLGEKEEAIKALELALKFNERYTVMIARSPYFVVLSSDPRLRLSR